MNKKLGLLFSPTVDEKSHALITQINEYYKDIKNYTKINNLVDIALFGEFNSPSFREKNFAFFHFQEAWDTANRVLIAFDLNMSNYLINIVTKMPKYFFIQDLEWTRLNPKNFNDLSKIYNNKSLNIITKSQDHADIFSQCWNRDVYKIINNYNLNDLIQLTEV